MDVDLRLGEMTVITGPSGSGKSSLAFDTIYAEGQRRYVETFSPYMRQFLDRMDKPRVDDIRGIPPAIAIEQSNPVKSSRSTVGTMTEINDYLKLLWPRMARAFCPSCGREIRPETTHSIVNEIFKQFGGAKTGAAGHKSDAKDALVTRVAPATPGIARASRAGFGASPKLSSAARVRDGEGAIASTRGACAPQNSESPQNVLITFWVSVPAKTKPREFFEFLQQQGYLRVWLNGEIQRVDADAKVERLGARVQVIQDRIAITEENRARIAEAIETALRFGKDKINVIADCGTQNAERENGDRSAIRTPQSEFPFSTGWHCAHCDIDIRPPTPGLFSFNNPLGACPECRGFGRTIAIDLNKAIPDRSLSIAEGAIRVFRGNEFGQSQKDLLRACAREEIDTHIPFEELPKSDQHFVIEGEPKPDDYEEDEESGRWYGVRGFFRWLEGNTYKMHVRVLLSRYRAYTTCPSCHGGRFQPETLNYQIVPVAAFYDRRSGEVIGSAFGGHRPPLQGPLTLAAFDALSIADAREMLANLEIEDATAAMLRKEICARLHYLCEVGLGYLTLDRSTRTLSGGEVQRVNLTTCLGASLVNTLFVMDEPSIGLHPRDIGRLVRVMHTLRDKGNTLLVVEHEEQIIRASDNLIDIGPGRGERGGELVFAGKRDALLSQRDSLTADYLSGRKKIPLPKSRRKFTSTLKIAGAREHNLKNIDVEIPLGVFTCVTGVSGSGKSTLIHDVLYRHLLRAKGESSDQEAGACKAVTGAHRFGKVVMVDQSALARTPRSTPILYLGLYDRVRELFAALPEAQAQGLTASAFSFNSGSGRCERCNGTGFEKIEMQFLSDLYVRCAECEGQRFQPHVLKIKLRGKSIHDVLDLTVTEAGAWFAQIGEKKTLADPLSILEEVGLGYLRLGQPLNTLSGGESQRLKLVSHLTDKAGGGERNLFIFDEPTTGLHFDDVAVLLQMFQRLVEAGHSVLVIEHNLEVIKCADWVIDLGPEAGDDGGEIVATGTPEQVAKVEASHTGRFLRESLGSARASRAVRGASPRIPANVVPDDADDFSLRVAEEPFGEAPNGAREARALPGRSPREIAIHGAREHNLKNISLTIPRDQLVVITGLSGSGKSTIAFDLLFAEGQR
ncbi:MAG: excinuclease ABC subunit UvrA, partial [Verrucomicrobiota bacterium]|nr:excinuclease ABC subunit UvrA [Verrucomicrobiota bacterium]